MPWPWAPGRPSGSGRAPKRRSGRRRGPKEEEAAAAESPEVVPWALVSGMHPRSWRAAFWVGEGAGEEAG